MQGLYRFIRIQTLPDTHLPTFCVLTSAFLSLPGLDEWRGGEQLDGMKSEAADAMSDSRKADLKPLWAIFWRVLILVPFLWVLGIGLLAVVVGTFLLLHAAFISAVIAFVAGDYLYGIAALIGWLVLLRFRNLCSRWVLDESNDILELEST